MPYRIAIVGPGRIGSAFAFQLVRAGGHNVTVVARPGSDRLAQLKTDQAIVNDKNERANVRVADGIDPSEQYDLIIVTLLAHQVATALPALQASTASRILFMFNNFRPELLEAAIGDRCVLGMPFIQANFEQDGRLKASIGAGGQKSLIGEQRWVDVFNAAGLPATFEPKMALWLRSHAPMCVAFESVSIAGVRRGGGASWSDAIVLARGVHAAFGLIKALGHSVYPQSKQILDRSPSAVVAAILWTMSRIRSFRELLATGGAECRALVEAMVSAAQSCSPPVDTTAISEMKPRD
jgi:2-dehydropantoate 2-reductase